MYGNDTVLSSVLLEVVDSLLDGLGDRAHGYDDLLCVRSSVVLERAVCASGKLAELAHIAGHHVRNGLVVLVPGLHSLEVNVSVLGCTPGDRSLRRKRAGSESLERFLADHLPEIVLVNGLDLLNLV